MPDYINYTGNSINVTGKKGKKFKDTVVQITWVKCAGSNVKKTDFAERISCQ
jgi:hypothetical protein